jgi:hypothetical protein
MSIKTLRITQETKGPEVAETPITALVVATMSAKERVKENNKKEVNTWETWGRQD